MDLKIVKELSNSFEQSQAKKYNSYFEYFKSISSLSVGLIGLLIGLKSSPIPNQEAKVAFLIAIILIALCILFSLAIRFYEIVAYKQEVEYRRLNILKYIENPSENKVQIGNINKHKFYKFSEIATFVCLLLSILALISYVYFLEFPLENGVKNKTEILKT
ncbi:hypothetical protein [Flavobacterium psychrophilum]|uniref:hypothetical protein n=1 Tax=Flavobacterium psychrophilum TaxID=96345 RepID=UPI001D07CD3F|nr:hypothetical protein [Flavobacterium psychrophilum]MCB6062602.1 hypothetical protein [Flavobacterium psychrophilum]